MLPDTTGYFDCAPLENLGDFGGLLEGILGAESAMIYDDDIPIGSLTELCRTPGYWLKLSGDVVDIPSISVYRSYSDLEYDLNYGNNLISFPSDESNTLKVGTSPF